MNTLVGGNVDQWTIKLRLLPKCVDVAAPRHSLYIYIFFYSI